MCSTWLWLLALLAFLSLTSLAAGLPMEVMSAPNLLRVGTAENIFVEIQGGTSENNIKVQITVMDHPTKTTILASTVVTLTKEKGLQDFGQIMIPPDTFKMDRNVKQYVYLRAEFPARTLEKVVLVSFQSGYIFIQTDKPIYTPGSSVYYRMFALTPGMEPIDTEVGVITEIVTPNGVIFEHDVVKTRSGIYSGYYRLSETDINGSWKVVAKFHSTPQQSFTAEFEVKDGVLPSFEVKLTSLSPFFYVDSQDLIVNIKATYLFGESVNGMAHVVFGIITQDGQKKGFPSSIQKVQIETGDGVVSLKSEHIRQTFLNINDLVGSSIYVSVSVLTESGSEMVEAELRGIKIVTSPYTINFKKTPKYFTPGIYFDVAVEVTIPDGSPAQGVAVVVDPGQVHGLTAADGIARVTVNTDARSQSLSVTARTNDPRVLLERQTSATMVALPYIAASNNYIHIGVDTTEVSLGQYLKVQLFRNVQEHQPDITYLILSAGQLVKYGRYQMIRQTLIVLKVLVTKEMLPSFRIIAYYHTSGNEVVADSVWVDVKDSCMGSLRLEASRPAPSYEPFEKFDLKVTGDPGATVGLVAVDRGAYALNNKHRLTQKKVWDIVEMFDTGCTPGRGKDSMGVFYDAGLLFESSVSGTPHRTDLRCPAHSRRKRASAEMEVGTSQSEEEDGYIDSVDIITRTRFPESWLWTDIVLPPCSDPSRGCETTSAVKHDLLKDSITTWVFTGISLSRTHGVCVSDPLEVIVWKRFFIDLKVPYSAVLGEQVEIKAILHNYRTQPSTVRVYLTEELHVCSAASKRGSYHQEVTILPRTSQSVPFVIVPVKEGLFSIKVTATVKGTDLRDGIIKKLRVMPQGVLTRSLMVLTLDPAKKGVGGKQDQIINSEVPLNDLVPGTPVTTEVYLKWIEPSENPISGNFMGRLIIRPGGSGEENMMTMTLPVIATTYLDKTNQWDAVGFEKRNEALQHINTGYRNELGYRKNDGSFASYSSRPSSTWLTAYVAKVFSMAYHLVAVQKQIICDAVKFLILNTQQPDGMFREVGIIYHLEMIGDVKGTESDASMTAFCLIATQESRSICVDTVYTLQRSIDKAVAYLERRLPSLTNPYAVAMTSYALANENKLNKEILNKFISPELGHWHVPKGHVNTLETTAYALLALVKAKAFEDAKPVVRWLKQQQQVDGGYGSTQATIMVYQAVAEYWARFYEPEYSLYVDISLPNRIHPVKFHFEGPFTSQARRLRFRGINLDVNVTATGNGEAMLTMESLYYALPKAEKSNCEKFNLSVELIPENTDEREMVYKLNIKVLYKDTERDATISILVIGLLTGFTPNTNDLDLLSKGRARTISRYEMNRVLSEKGSLIIYLDKVSHTQPEEISFRINQKFKVGVLQPAAVSVHEYYDQTHCEKFYQPNRNGRLLTHQINDEYICVGESCGMLRKDTQNTERIVKICESEYKFAYKVRVENFTSSLSSDLYTVRRLEVIKGRYNSGLEDTVYTFLSLPHCRAFLDLKAGKTYLVLGTTEEFPRDAKSRPYVLSERTWIEYWPTNAECYTEEHRSVCLGLEEMVQLYQIFGCQD
ncbi:complement C3-like [Centropristis striata]|uniref:complement C3-like n=1 Tax=Centropristis striata TaxID=184440 RepID=UPI0027E18D1F|nr:complement C3-like [Centropristis striata]